MSKISAAKDLEDFLYRHPQTRGMELLIPDINGILRGKRISPREFAGLYSEGINLPASSTLMDSRGRVVADLEYGGLDGDPDCVSHPVPGTLVATPWLADGMAQCLLEMDRGFATAGFADSRRILRRVCERLRADGLKPVCAVELEFYFLEDASLAHPRPRGGRTPGTGLRQSDPQMYSLEDLQDLDPLLADIERNCRIQELPASTAMSEYAPGQFEINLRHVDDPLVACDHAVLLKRLIRGTAKAHGLAASFMAKPFTEHSGSGQHLHVSLLDQQGTNALAADTDFEHAVAGLLALLSESMLMFCPNPNSYRRLQPGCYAPTASNWGHNHRGVVVREPLSDPVNRRLEHRLAGADANPYLAMAATLAGMHHGIEQQLSAPPPLCAGQEIDQPGSLARDWRTAWAAFVSGRHLPAYLGQDFIDCYATIRRWECQAFDAQVSSADYAWYLLSL